MASVSNQEALSFAISKLWGIESKASLRLMAMATIPCLSSRPARQSSECSLRLWKTQLPHSPVKLVVSRVSSERLGCTLNDEAHLSAYKTVRCTLYQPRALKGPPCLCYQQHSRILISFVFEKSLVFLFHTFVSIHRFQ